MPPDSQQVRGDRRCDSLPAPPTPPRRLPWPENRNDVLQPPVRDISSTEDMLHEPSLMQANASANSDGELGEEVAHHGFDEGQSITYPIILYLFSGPLRPPDDMATAVNELGYTLEAFDLEISPEHDLVDDVLWQAIENRILTNEFEAGIAAPPCSTYSGVRGQGCDSNGPRPLRGEEAPDKNGLPDLNDREKESVKLGTACALRALAMARAFHTVGKPWLIETPAAREGQPNVFKLPDYRDFMAKLGISPQTSVQCLYGSPFLKPTDWLANFSVGLEAVCPHPFTSWIVPWSGQRFWSKHPPLLGKQRAIPQYRWSEDMLGDEPNGPFISRAAALYPPALNRAVAQRLHEVISTQDVLMPKDEPDMFNSALYNKAGRPDIVFTNPLRGQASHPTYAKHGGGVGGVRNIAKSLYKAPGHYEVGPRIANVIEELLADNPDLEQAILQAIGSEDPPTHFINSFMDDLRGRIAGTLGSTSIEQDIAPADYGSCTSPVRDRLLHLWAQAAGDPAHFVPDWFKFGAPAGINTDFPDMSQIWAPAEDEDTIDPEELHEDPAHHDSDPIIDNGEDVWNLINKYKDKGWVKIFASHR